MDDDSVFGAREITPLVAALKVHAGSPDVCRVAGNALVNICRTPAAIQAAVSAGAILALVGALRVHGGHVIVCVGLWKALGNVVGCPDGAKEAFDVGALPLLLLALRVHTAHGDACNEVVRAVGNICSTPESVRFALTADAASLLVGALRMHATSPEVSSIICRAIFNLSIFPSMGRKEFVAKGATALLVDVLQTHVEDERACTGAIFALGNMCNLHPEGLESVLVAGALEPLVAALSHHMLCEKIRTRASEYVIEPVPPPTGKQLCCRLLPSHLSR